MSDVAKRAAGEAAARLVRRGMVVGLGTGSTAAFAVQALGRRVREEKLRVWGVPTSEDTRRLARRVGIHLTTLRDHPTLDLAIDGADQIDPRLNLIKGGWGAHTREKIVATASRRFIVVADPGKLTPVLDWPVPLEVLPMARPLVEGEVRRLGGSTRVRPGFKTDNGNPVLDARLGRLRDPGRWDRILSEIVGVVEHGIFPRRMVHRAIIGRADGVEVLRR
ncbi:MAG: ribose-5-phosphate isomerase RpiA [Euryarchaeota archaeon]|nr:ribose-5-phosphate isomerase RpiA [Euryarchaeota archaeon]